MNKFQVILDDIMSDFTSGGREIGYKALSAAEALYEYAVSSVPPKEEVINKLEMLKNIRPCMGISYNVGDILIKAVGREGDWIKNFKNTLDNLREILNKSKDEIRSRSKGLLKSEVYITTLSFSSNVITFIERNRDYIKGIYLLESRPGTEVKYAYETFRNMGFDVKVYPDSAINFVTRGKVAIVIGMDAITLHEPHLIHKVGTNPLLTVAYMKSIDRFVVGESLKIIDANTHIIIPKKWKYRVEELELEIEVYPFDKTPVKYIEYLVTDLGIVRGVDERSLIELYIKLLLTALD